jgi:hypothetical protein
MMYNRSHLVFRLGMNNLSLLPQIGQILSKLNLKRLARKSGFECRKPRKITAHNFILALLALASQGSVALRRQAQLIGWLGEHSVSKQAVRERALKGRGFIQLIVHKLLDERLPTASSRSF